MLEKIYHSGKGHNVTYSRNMELHSYRPTLSGETKNGEVVISSYYHQHDSLFRHFGLGNRHTVSKVS